jgi:biotin synthase-like enzyme
MRSILDFAQLAQNENIELFCFGTLGNAVAKRPEYWSQLIKKIKKIYSGKLTYAANWDG